MKEYMEGVSGLIFQHKLFTDSTYFTQPTTLLTLEFNT